MPALERLSATRIAASAVALDAARWPEGAIVLRTAPDEAVVIDDDTARVTRATVVDAHAIVAAETGLFGVWISTDETVRRLDRHCAWDWRRRAGPLAQGAVAGLPVKIWFEADRALWIVPEPFASEFEARLS